MEAEKTEALVVRGESWLEQLAPNEAQDVEVAIKETGLTRLNLRRIRGYSKVSKMLKSVGLIEVERGLLALRQEAMATARDELVRMVISGEVPDEIRVAAAEALRSLVVAENETTELNLRLEELERSTAPVPKPGQGLPPAGVVVQNLVSVQPAPVEKVASPS